MCSKSSFSAELKVSSNFFPRGAQLPEAAAARRIETYSPKHSKQRVRSSAVHLVSVLELCLACTSTRETRDKHIFGQQASYGAGVFERRC